MVSACYDFPCGGGKPEMEEIPLNASDVTEGEPKEINYDSNSLTYLYQAIEEKAFMAAIDFLESGKAEVIDECRTWVTRYELRNPKKIRWSQLPLHAAIVFGGPPRLIELLVQKYPRACRCTDDQSMLPIHLAFRFGAPDAVLHTLIKEFPEALDAKDNKGRYPLQLAPQGEAWKKGEIISYFEKNTKKRVIKNKAKSAKTQADDTLIARNNELEETNKTLKDENEKFKAELEKVQMEVKKLEAQKNKLRLMKRKDVQEQAAQPKGIGFFCLPRRRNKVAVVSEKKMDEDNSASIMNPAETASVS